MSLMPCYPQLWVLREPACGTIWAFFSNASENLPSVRTPPLDDPSDLSHQAGLYSSISCTISGMIMMHTEQRPAEVVSSRRGRGQFTLRRDPLSLHRDSTDDPAA
jgi:hypothetical protein